MRIILLHDIKKQGKKGDVLEVKDGYGQFLITQGKAIMATNQNIGKLNQEKKEQQKLEQEEIKECQKIKQKLEQEIIVFKVKTGLQDKVFGSISVKQINEQLNKMGYKIDKKQIIIDSPLDCLGIHNINIKLHKQVIATIKVNLTK